MDKTTTKIKLLPNEEQKELLLKTLKQMKDGLNFASEVAYENNCLAHSKKLQKLVYNDLREKFGLKSQMACNACNIVSFIVLFLLQCSEVTIQSVLL